jgi:hypothetical protein
MTFKEFQQVKQVSKRARNPIELGDEDCLDTTVLHQAHQCVEARP